MRNSRYQRRHEDIYKVPQRIDKGDDAEFVELELSSQEYIKAQIQHIRSHHCRHQQAASGKYFFSPRLHNIMGYNLQESIISHLVAEL